MYRSENPRNEPGPNCLLSEYDQRDLRPGEDYIHDHEHWLFAWNSLDPRCELGDHIRPGRPVGPSGPWRPGGPPRAPNRPPYFRKYN